jgi:hypothetical protein
MMILGNVPNQAAKIIQRLEIKIELLEYLQLGMILKNQKGKV